MKYKPDPSNPMDLHHFNVCLSDSELDRPHLGLGPLRVEPHSIVVFTGPPGAGKGTQAAVVAQRLGMVHVSTGDLFRAEVRAGSDIGKAVASYMDAGVFVPPEITNKVLAGRLEMEDTAGGVILDGFPRTIDHLKDLDVILGNGPKRVIASVHIDISEGEALRRISCRRLCSTCKGTVHVDHDSLVCPACGATGSLTQREDDKEETVRRRYQLFQATNTPLMEEFARRDLLYSLNGSASISRTSDRITEVICYPQRFGYGSQSAFKRLEAQLSFRGNEIPSVEMVSLVSAFRDAALEENIKKRTGAVRRFVYLCTTSSHKLAEFVSVFDKYGIEVLQVPDYYNVKAAEGRKIGRSGVHANVIEALLKEKTKELVPLAVLKEDTSLLKPGGSDIHSSRRPGEHLSYCHDSITQLRGHRCVCRPL